MTDRRARLAEIKHRCTVAEKWGGATTDAKNCLWLLAEVERLEAQARQRDVTRDEQVKAAQAAYYEQAKRAEQAEAWVRELEADNAAKDVAFDKLDRLCVNNHERKKQAEARARELEAKYGK
jgi:hypothetical protein